MSKHNNSFVKQAVILAAAGLISRLLGFLFRIFLTPYLGDEGNGIYGESYNIYMFLLVLSSAGLPAAISKMVSERLANKEYKSAHMVFTVALKVAFVSGLLGALIMWVGAPYFSFSRGYYATVALAPTMFIVAIMAVYRGYFQGMGNTMPTAISQIIEQIFNVASSFLLAVILVKYSLELGAAGGTAGTGIGAFFGLITVWGIYCLAKPRIYRRMRKDKKRNSTDQWKTAKELIFTAAPIIAGMAVFSITNIIDTKMVMILLTKDGLYNDAQAYDLFGQLSVKYVTLVTLPVSISTAMATAVIPSLAGSFKIKDITAVKYKINMALKLAMVISIPAAIGIGVLSDQILALLFPTHPSGGMLLKVGSISIIFLALCQIVTGILQGVNNIYVPVIAALFGAAFKVVLNAFLIPIPEINVLGAVISTTGCYLLASVINMVVMSKKMNIIPDLVNVFLKPLAASVVMGIACYVSYSTLYMLMPYNTVCLFVSILLSVATYFGFLYLIGGIDEEMIRLLPFGNRILKLVSESEE